MAETDHQEIYNANADAKIFDECDDLKKQKRKHRTRK